MKCVVNAVIVLLLVCCLIGSTSIFTMGFTRDQLISLRNIKVNDSQKYISVLRSNGIFKYQGPRGCRAGSQVQNKKFFIQTVNAKSTPCPSRKSVVHSQQGINMSNLTQIPCTGFKDNGWKLSQFCHLNAQSVKNKTHSIKDYLIEKDIQMCMITETWLKPQNELEMAEITPVGYKLDPLHRLHNKAGGIAIIHNLRLNAKVSDKGQFSSYDYMEIHVPLGSDSVRLLVVYHPPYNNQSNPVPDSIFLEESASQMERVLPTTGYLVITGDFNIHVNLLELSYDSLSDSKKEYWRTARKFMDILDSMGLNQHIVGPTHRSGYTLDLLITRSTDAVLQGKPCVDAMLSDHCSILFKVQVENLLLFLNR